MSSALLVEWKQEPVSPLSNDEASWVAEESLYWTSLEQTDLKVETEFAACDTKAEIASKLLDDLDQLEDLDEWIKEEPFPSWLDEKFLDDVDPAPTAQPVVTPVKMEDVKVAPVPDTQSLLKEFEIVYDAVEFTHGTLTPPQSPPYEQPLLTTLEPISAAPQPATYTILGKQAPIYHQLPESNVVDYPRGAPLIPVEYPPAATPQPDVAHELAVVDELVRTRVENMVQWSSPASPSSSSSSNFGDCSSSDDPEWVPEIIDPNPYSSNTLPKTQRKRTKPYARTTPEDKKSRKKEQNKNAATRYRMKKKAEVEEILGEERNLQKKNDELENQIGDLQREIKYLKGLMRDLFKAKGLIN